MAGNTPLGRMLIDIDLDTTKLGSSTTHLQRQMRIVNSAMRANLASLKDSGKESDVLGVKIDGLNKRQKIQQGIVEQTEKRYKELVATKGATAKETEAYANTLNREQAKLREVTAELKEMERQQKVMDSNWTKLGNSFGSLGSQLTSIGGGIKSVGSSLTNSITKPALGVATAVGGIVAAFGWKRLVSLDAAQAQLLGLGYTIEDVDRISSQVQSAVEGTTMTMAEGTSVAAGALAAGIEEGEELEHYIKMIGNAAVGANRPIGDMAMIFNRVQGSGKLMTEELNMIEDGMPGFSSKMAEHFGVTQEEFRKMVTEGQVTSEDFLTVMESHAGGMAAAYADSWQGMVSNTGAWVGILGEQLLSGVFEQSKDSLNEFLQILSSEKAQQWATETGKKISTAFGQIVDTVKGAVDWFTKLKDEKKQLIGIATGLAVAAGPLLTVLGTGAIFIGKVATALAPLATKIGQAGGLFKFLGGTIAALATPVGVGVAIIAALTAGFVIAYKRSETFRDGIHSIIAKVKETWTYLKTFGTGVKELFTGSEGNGVKILSALGVTDDNIKRITGLRDNIMSVKDKAVELGKTVVAQVKPALDKVMSFIGEVGSKLSSMWSENSATIIPVVTNIGNIISTVFSAIFTTIQFIMPAVFAIIKMVWSNIEGVIRGALKIIDGLVKVFSGIFTGDFSKMWEGVKSIFTGAIQLIWNGFQLLFYGRIIKGVGSLVSLFTGSIRGLWTRVVDLFTRLFQSSTQIISNMNTAINKTVSSLVKGVFNFFRNMLTNTTSTVNNLGRNVWNLFQTMRIRVVETVKTLLNAVKNTFTNMLNNVRTITTRLKDTAVSLFRTVLSTVSNVVKTLYNTVKNTFTNMFNAVRNTVTMLRNTASNIFTSLRTSVTNTVRSLFNSVRNFFSNMLSSVRNTVTTMRNTVTNLINRMKDGAVNGVRNMKERISTLFTNVKDNARKAFENMVKGAKELPSKLGNAISNGKQKAVNGIKALGNSMINQLEKVVNGLIRGLNNVTGKIGITATVKEWSAPKFSTGTGSGSLTRNGAIAQDTLATVGDKGFGNGSGTRELVQYPNGTTGLYDNDATIFAPKGTVIWNNKQTEDILAGIPQFSRGTNAGSGAKDGGNKSNKKGILGTMKDVLANTWDYIKNPKKAFDAIVSNVGAKFDGLKGFAATAAKGGFNFIKDKAFEWMKGIFKDNEGGEVNGGSILNRAITARFGNYPANIARQLGVTRHYGLDTAHRYERLTSPVTGKVTKVWHDRYGGNAIQIKAGDLNWWFMHMKSISKKVGDAVKAGKTNLGVTGNTGLRTTGYHLHTQAMKGGIGNGYAIDPLPLLKKAGFATGGLVNNGLYALGEEGHPEWVIPTDPKRRTDAMKLLAYAGKSLQKNNGNLRPNNLPNLPTDNTNTEIAELKQMLANQQEMISLLAKIAEKDYVALYNEKHLARDIEPEVSKRQKFNNDRDTRLA